MKKFIFTFAAFTLFFAVEGFAKVKGALLQAEIHAVPYQSSPTDKIQPGTKMQLLAAVRNIGDMPSAAGEIYIRFALPKPLDKQKNSVIFETEKIALPSLKAGEQTYFEFLRPHQWPSLFDFIRNDWAMREYEVVADVGNHPDVIGTRVISFSAYYYEGPAENKAVKVSSAGL